VAERPFSARTGRIKEECEVHFYTRGGFSLLRTRGEKRKEKDKEEKSSPPRGGRKKMDYKANEILYRKPALTLKRTNRRNPGRKDFTVKCSCIRTRNRPAEENRENLLPRRGPQKIASSLNEEIRRAGRGKKKFYRSQKVTGRGVGQGRGAFPSGRITDWKFQSFP